MQWVICQGSRLPFLAALVATKSSLHFYVKFSRFVRMGRYGEHKENSDHFEFSVVVWTMRLWANVVIFCKQRTTCEIYVKIRKMFLEKSKMTHVAEIAPIIPLYFALNQSNSHALLLSSWNQWLAGPTPCRSQPCAFLCHSWQNETRCNGLLNPDSDLYKPAA